MTEQAKHTADVPRWLHVADAPDTPHRPYARPYGSGFRAEISGIEGGAVVRSWVGEVYARKADALAAAIAKAEGR